jgi:hypothetical protein
MLAPAAIPLVRAASAEIRIGLVDFLSSRLQLCLLSSKYRFGSWNSPQKCMLPHVS